MNSWKRIKSRAANVTGGSPALQQRDTMGHADILLPLLRSRDVDYYRELLPAGEMLRSSSFNFLTGRSTASVIVSEVCQAIWDVLGPIYVALPSTQNEWSKVASDFKEKWDMSHCLGAIDGKHVIVECPANSGSRDRNYKGSFSKSLMEISDANYSFLYVEIGHNGSESDGGIFNRSKLQPLVPNGTLGIPPVACLGSIGNVPYFLLVTRHFL
ncbi:uncharacterized protein LOC142764804 isoform X1 [Rhipicephalus microplus]|uniref:uncharacterized protein LOC142764804 isoform X1 n=1 Tax=Rhipicephalus microplus TaxID=6941 RepID=UPI003F6AC133